MLPPLQDNRHRGPDAAASTTPSELGFTLQTTVGEIADRIRAMNQPLHFPAGSDRESEDGIRALSDFLNDRNRPVELQMSRSAGGAAHPQDGASVAAFRVPGSQLVMEVTDQDGLLLPSSRGPQVDNLGMIFETFPNSFFYFGSQRVNVGRIGISDEIVLHSDASNLPTVLSNIKETRAPLFEAIEQHVCDIIPDIERITIVSFGGHYEILLWPFRTGAGSDINFKLNESGSGIGQLLAILCAVAVSPQSVVVIDEINTYLHQAAIHKLLRVLQTEYRHHQYIVSAHSTDVLFGANAERIYAVTKTRLVSTVKLLDLKNTDAAREVAGLLGFSMLDVFGNDRLIWVEGSSEELVFPLILAAFDAPLGPEWGICSVGLPSSFTASETRSSEVYAIYENAGKRLSPLLKGMAFGLDREGLDDAAVAHFERSRKKLRFLPRRCLENYFLDPDAISQVFSDLGENIDSQAVEHSIMSLANHRKFHASKEWATDIEGEEWLKVVDGAKLLSEVFSTLTEKRYEFRKTRDNVSLAKFMLMKKKEKLKGLNAFIENLVRIAGKDSAP